MPLPSGQHLSSLKVANTCLIVSNARAQARLPAPPVRAQASRLVPSVVAAVNNNATVVAVLARRIQPNPATVAVAEANGTTQRTATTAVWDAVLVTRCIILATVAAVQVDETSRYGAPLAAEQAKKPAAIAEDQAKSPVIIATVVEKLLAPPVKVGGA